MNQTFIFFFLIKFWISLNTVKGSETIPGVNASLRIVGGELVAQGEIGYQVLLRYKLNKCSGTSFCGGSLVVVRGTQLVLTAAHCLEFTKPEELTLVAGEVKRSDRTGYEQTRRVRKIINHEEYNPLLFANDISILVPDRPFELNEYVYPIQLPVQGLKTEGNLLASGWGYTQEGSGVISDNLLKIQIPLVNFKECQGSYAAIGIVVPQSVICAGNFIDGGKDVCGGDSGGPLRALNGGYLAGIVSAGNGCARPRFPTYYTEVAKFIKWILEKERNLWKPLNICNLFRQKQS